jgi:hypothetical protein
MDGFSKAKYPTFFMNSELALSMDTFDFDRSYCLRGSICLGKIYI